MVHQANGRGIGKFAETTVGKFQEDIMVELGDLVHRMLPKSTREAVAEAVLKIVDKAVMLKTEMTEEPALYHCIWIDYGEEYKEEYIEAMDGDPTSRVFICLFPGLARTFKKDNNVSDFYVVKARVAMESDFEIDGASNGEEANQS
jgi:hypothetical protein